MSIIIMYNYDVHNYNVLSLHFLQSIWPIEDKDDISNVTQRLSSVCTVIATLIRCLKVFTLNKICIFACLCAPFWIKS